MSGMATDNEWLKSLKEGDKVFIENINSMGSRLILDTVKKITPTGKIRTSNDMLFKNGDYHAGAWTFYNLVQWTQTLEDELNALKELKSMIYKIREFDFRKLSFDQVSRMYGIINERCGDE